ncbi:MAG TPA: hypothetical protein VMR76_02895 [Candidatus Saccharimonadia bacterium]|nr:hypothetical protein [Candidatus Saccharimonadia bacterium]
MSPLEQHASYKNSPEEELQPLSGELRLYWSVLDWAKQRSVHEEASLDEASAAYTEEEAQRLQSAITTLSARDQAILTMSYGFGGEKPKTFVWLARDFGLTPKRVSLYQKRSTKALSEILFPDWLWESKT